jgi:hypothetical protein
MTTISASTAYALQALYGQNATQSANTQTSSTKTGTAQTGTQSSTSSTTASTTNAASLADILAAARNSASLPFATVGQNARSVLDAGVAAYGQTPTDQTSADDWNAIFGGMDRRSLFAVSSNQGGQFSTLEQTAAKALMSAQVTDAGTVNSSDPISTQLAGYAKRIDLLSNVSPEEKQTATWAYAYAAARTNANMIDFDSRMPQTDSSSSPLVSVLMGAMNNAQTQAGTAIDFGSVDNIGQITSQSWATNYASQIESAFAASYNPGTSINLSA